MADSRELQRQVSELRQQVDVLTAAERRARDVAEAERRRANALEESARRAWQVGTRTRQNAHAPTASARVPE